MIEENADNIDKYIENDDILGRVNRWETIGEKEKGIK